jgi:hypothetical protein
MKFQIKNIAKGAGKVLFLAITLLFISGFGLQVTAATLAGTDIAPGTFTMIYSNGVSAASTYNVEIGDAVTVEAFYAIDVTPPTTDSVAIEYNETTYYHQAIENISNTAASISYTLDDISSLWTATVYFDDNSDGVHQPGEVTVATSAITIAAESTKSIFVVFTAPSTYVSPAIVKFHPVIVGTPTGSYTGFNSTVYGGEAEFIITENAELALMSKISLQVLLHGYYDAGSNTQEPATVNLQFRSVQGVDSGPSVNVSLATSGETGNSGSLDISGVSGNYYLVVKHKLEGLPLGVNHVAYISSENITFIQDQVVTVNLIDSGNQYYHAPYIKPGTSYGFNSLLQLQPSGKWVIKGGDSSGDRIINITDIIKWNNSATNPNSDNRGDGSWTEEANFDGNGFMNTDDFSIWNTNRSQPIPLPED